MRAVRAKALRKLAYLGKKKQTEYETFNMPKQAKLEGGSITVYAQTSVSKEPRRTYQTMKKIWGAKKAMPNLLGGTK